MSKAAWQEQVEWMRANGVVSAKWSDNTDQLLVECIIGPDVSQTATPTAEEFKAQLEKQKKDAEDALDLLDFGAS